MMYNCIIILGPTASGKTGLSVELAKRLNGEVINADSQQIIKELNIGTAKITEEEKQNIPHHLFDIIEVGQEFSVSEYSTLALEKIDEILSRNKLPIVVGGTGFYINSLLYKYTFGNADKDESIREYYESLAKEKGNTYVYNILKELDPESATTLHENDLKRVIRAIEIYKTSGDKKSNQQLITNDKIHPYIIGLNVDRDLLYDRINKRVDLMINNGLENEVLNLKSKGFYSPNNKYQLPIGYSEWTEYFNNNLTKEEVIEKIKLNSRHYAKRQITWFKKVNNVNWIRVGDDFNFNKLIDGVVEKLKK